jgi:hypothetical protein
VSPPSTVVVDSITDLDPAMARNKVVVCGSHGGRYVGELATYFQVHGLICNDAGVGRDEAGIAGLSVLAMHGIPGVAVSHLSARIGNGLETVTGHASHLNSAARDLQCGIGQRAEIIAEHMLKAPSRAVTAEPPLSRESRHLERDGLVKVWTLDSASLVKAEDIGCVLVTGSHGGTPGGQPERALKGAAIGAVFNDAGGGRGRAGWSRLAVLDRQGIAAVTVSASSARIGDGRSSLYEGVLSHVNDCAARLGVVTGSSATDFVDRVIDARKVSQP